MFILRTAFWLSLVVLVLPTDARQQEALSAKIMSSVNRVATFCDRNQKTCETGARYWAVFRQKADYGVQLAIGLISEQLRGGSDDHAATAQRSSGGTLRQDDLAPRWRGKSAQDRI